MKQRHREILAFIVERYVAGGPLPTGRELMAKFNWRSTASPFNNLLDLEAAGAIRRAPGSPRYGIVMSHPVVAELLRESR